MYNKNCFFKLDLIFDLIFFHQIRKYRNAKKNTNTKIQKRRNIFQSPKKAKNYCRKYSCILEFYLKCINPELNKHTYTNMKIHICKYKNTII